jgi:hypothetical protein
MLGSLRRWRPRHLLIAWIAYWIAFAVVGLGPAVPAILRATRAGNGQGTISLSFANGLLELVVKVRGITTWSGSSHLLPLVLWLVVPPVLLWLAWLSTRRRHEAEARSAERV